MPAFDAGAIVGEDGDSVDKGLLAQPERRDLRVQRLVDAAGVGWIGDIVAIGEPELRQLRCEGEGALLIDLRRDGAAATNEGKRP